LRRHVGRSMSAATSAAKMTRKVTGLKSARVEAGVIVEIRTPETCDRCIPDVYDALWSPEGGPRAEARHGDALLDALVALVGYQVAAAAVLAAGIEALDCNDALANEIAELSGDIAARRQDADCTRDGCTAVGCIDRARADAERDWYAHALTRPQHEAPSPAATCI
jgi:hypothetical protein